MVILLTSFACVCPQRVFMEEIRVRKVHLKAMMEDHSKDLMSTMRDKLAEAKRQETMRMTIARFQERVSITCFPLFTVIFFLENVESFTPIPCNFMFLMMLYNKKKFKFKT